MWSALNIQSHLVTTVGCNKTVAVNVLCVVVSLISLKYACTFLTAGLTKNNHQIDTSVFLYSPLDKLTEIFSSHFSVQVKAKRFPKQKLKNIR